MTGFAATWPNTNIDDDGESNPPPEPGTYCVSVQGARAFTSKAGNEVLIVELRILDGPKEGYIYPVLHGFKTEGQTKAAKSLCARLGIDVGAVASLQELDEQIKLTIGTYYTVDVVQNGDYRNTFVNGKMTGDEVPVSDVPSDGSEFVPTPVKATDDVPIPW